MLVFAVLTLWACGETVQPDVFERSPSVRIISGDRQTGTLGSVLDTLKVRFTDENGAPIGGRIATWTVSSGAGAITPVSATTDDGGFASALWTLGTTVGDFTATVTIQFFSLTFAATAVADAAHTIARHRPSATPPP